MIQIRQLILVFATLIFIISCSNSKTDSKSMDSEIAIEQKNDSVNNNISHKTKQLKTEDRYPKVLTYNEITEKNQELLKDFEESKRYRSDTIAVKNRMNKSFYSYLTTQLKYMLSSELRLLRNEFFARKGYKFKSNELNDYFRDYYWYNPTTEDVNNIVLSPLEKAIIDTITVYEKKNEDLNTKSLKKSFRDYCKNNLRKEYDRNIIEIPSILFRRNLGYQVKGLFDNNKAWFNGEFLRIQVIDTLRNDNLLFGLFGQIMCPDQFCLYGGELITCDSSLDYIDSKPIEFETIKHITNGQGDLYRFDAPNSSSSTLVQIDEDGKINFE